MNLDEWAERWGIPDEAVRELASVGSNRSTPDNEREHTEAGVQSRVRIEAAEAGWHLWRNNVGAGYMRDGSFVRWGLANDSRNLNAKLKSGDLIGWRPRLLKVDDVGKVIAQFVSRECKRSDWKFTGTPEEQAQVRWHALVTASGGDSAIINSTGSIHA
jgi:hypothetical protein